MFGRRKRDEAAAAEAAREAERRALFTKLAERPEHICPFLGLADERTGYVDGVSDEHRCFAFGDPAPLSAEQQTRVCQERGYGNCPRYLRGVLVIPTEELEALRRPRAPIEAAPPPPPPLEQPRRRRAAPLLLLLGVLVLLVGAGAYVLFGDRLGIAIGPSPSPSPTAGLATPPATSSPGTSTTPTGSGQLSPTPEPTPDVGDTFAFYEVSVGPGDYRLFELDAGGTVIGARLTTFDAFSFAQAEPRAGDDSLTYWLTMNGDLAGWAYRVPDSGPFRIRAVFLDPEGMRRSYFLEDDALTEIPEATPAP